MQLRGRKIIEPKIFRKWWNQTSKNANPENIKEIFEMVNHLTWVRMVAGEEFDPRGLSGEINKGKKVASEKCDPNYQYYYYTNDGKGKLYLLWPTDPSASPNVGNNRWRIQSYGSTGWSLGINPIENKLFHAAINKQNYP